VNGGIGEGQQVLVAGLQGLTEAVVAPLNWQRRGSGCFIEAS
jgi:hypothetical protein